MSDQPPKEPLTSETAPVRLQANLPPPCYDTMLHHRHNSGAACSACEIVSLRAELSQAREAGREYIASTDPLLSCPAWLHGGESEPRCGTCRMCVIEERDALRESLMTTISAMRACDRHKHLVEALEANMAPPFSGHNPGCTSTIPIGPASCCQGPQDPPSEAPPYRVVPNGPPCPTCGFAITESVRSDFAIDPEEPPDAD